MKILARMFALITIATLASAHAADCVDFVKIYEARPGNPFGGDQISGIVGGGNGSFAILGGYIDNVRGASVAFVKGAVNVERVFDFALGASGNDAVFGPGFCWSYSASYYNYIQTSYLDRVGSGVPTTIDSGGGKYVYASFTSLQFSALGQFTYLKASTGEPRAVIGLD